MKNVLAAGLFLFLAIPGHAQRPARHIQVYILLGQSNMAGRGAITEEYQRTGDPRVIMLTKNDEWVTAKHPLHFDKPRVAGVGPGLSFGIDMAAAYPHDTIALVPCAVGGTSIDKWTPGAYDRTTDTHPYDDALIRIKKAMKKGPVKGIIWLQGESDSDSASAQRYLGKLIELILRLRKETGDPSLPFVAGELGRYKAQYQHINKVLADLPSRMGNTTVVSSEGLHEKGDNTHFDSPSATIYGKRFAAGMLRIQRR